MADSIDQRRNVASKGVDAATRFVDALYDLLMLKDQKTKFADPFSDADFTNTDLKHLTASMLNVLFDDVVPNLNTNFLDVPNGGRNEQILFQVRRG